MTYYQKNRERLLAYQKEYAATDSGKASARRKRDKTEQITRGFVKEYLLTHPCIECGEGRTPCLDFHHLKPSTKKMSIHDMLKKRYSLNTIKLEIDKCIVLCKNCHALEHEKTRHTQSMAGFS